MSSLPTVVFPADAKVYPSLRLVTWHPRGLLDVSLAREIFAFAEAEESSTVEPFDRFTDLSALTAIHLSLQEIEELARDRARDYQGPGVKSAILASNPLAFGIAQMYEHLMRQSAIEVRVFCLLTSATAWLEKPIEILVSGG